MSRDPTPRPGPRRMGRAAVAAIVILVVVVIVMFVGRNIWHASEVDEAPPEIRQNP